MQNFLECTKKKFAVWLYIILFCCYLLFRLLFECNLEREKKEEITLLLQFDRAKKKNELLFCFGFGVWMRETVCMCVLINCNKHIVSIDVVCFFSFSLLSSLYYLLHMYIQFVVDLFFHLHRSFAIESFLLWDNLIIVNELNDEERRERKKTTLQSKKEQSNETVRQRKCQMSEKKNKKSCKIEIKCRM